MSLRETFFVSAEIDGVRHDLGKFFSREAAERHAKNIVHARGHSDVRVREVT